MTSQLSVPYCLGPYAGSYSSLSSKPPSFFHHLCFLFERLRALFRFWLNRGSDLVSARSFCRGVFSIYSNLPVLLNSSPFMLNAVRPSTFVSTQGSYQPYILIKYQRRSNIYTSPHKIVFNVEHRVAFTAPYFLVLQQHNLTQSEPYFMFYSQNHNGECRTWEPDNFHKAPFCFSKIRDVPMGGRGAI